MAQQKNNNQYLRVKNWDDFQHYSDRNPPWIKLYNTLLSDYDFTCLQDDSKLQLIMIYLIASQTNNVIPYDEKWIQNKAMLENPVDLEPLIDAGFLLVEQYDSSMIAERKQGDRPEQRRAEESRGEQRRAERDSNAQAMHKHTTSNANKSIEEKSIEDQRKEEEKIPSQFLELSENFFEYQQEQFPNLIKGVSERQIARGAETLEKMHRLDGMAVEDIKEVLGFAVQDDFWASNVLSPASLRKKGSNGQKKYINILAAMQRNGEVTKKKKQQRAYEAFLND